MMLMVENARNVHVYSLFTTYHTHSVISLGQRGKGRSIGATHNEYYVKRQ